MMTQQIISQIDLRIKYITNQEIESLTNNNKISSSRLNAIKMELLELKIFIIDLWSADIKEQLKPKK